MALSIEELELESADYLPAREVMTTLGLKGGGHGGGDYIDPETGGLLGLDLDIPVFENQVQVGLVNVQLDDSFNNWTFLNGLFNGTENDLLDVL